MPSRVSRVLLSLGVSLVLSSCGGGTDTPSNETASDSLSSGAVPPSGTDGGSAGDQLPGRVHTSAADSPGSEAVETHLWFTDMTSESGISFQHHPHRTEERYLPETMGGGVTLADINRDGAPDVICFDSGPLKNPVRPPDERDRVYLNDGKGHFTDVTDEWKLTSAGYGMGGAVADFDGDGWVDLFTTHFGGGDRLYRNTGSEFVDVTEEAGIAPDTRWSTSAGFFDLEGDGDLDLYVANYVEYQVEGAMRCFLLDVHHYCSPHLFEGQYDRLLVNNGDGTFTDRSKEKGIEIYKGKGLGVILGDVDWDGDQDIYVANDVTRNLLFINQGQGVLDEVGLLSGVALSESGKAEAGMGVDLADYDLDGHLDIVCTNFQGETNSIYRQEDGFFQEVSDAVGIGEESRAKLGFGVDFVDADNDGDEDILVVNGHVDDNVSAQTPGIEFAQPNFIFENRNGKLVDVTAGAGPAFDDVQVSRGLMTGDLDGDGDIDAVIATNGGTLTVMRNESQVGGFVSLLLKGAGRNTSAIGARVEATVGGRVLWRQVLGASSYLGTNDPRIHIGLGDATKVDELKVYWPDGQVDTFGQVAGGAFYYLEQGGELQTYVPGAGTLGQPPQ